MRKRIWQGLGAALLCVAMAGVGSADELTFVDRVVDNAVLSGASSASVSPDGNFVYVAAPSNSSIGVFARNHDTGALSFSSVVKDGVGGVDGIAGVVTLTLSSNGLYLYAAGRFSNAIAVFSRNVQTGALTQIQTLFDEQGGVDGLYGVTQLALSADEQSLYSSAYFDFAVAAFDRDPATGLLTFVRQRSYEFGATPDLGNVNGIAVSPDGGTVYVGGESGARVFLFNRTANDIVYSGTTLFDSLVQPLGGPTYMKFSPDGAQLYVAAEFDRAITIFDLGVAGALTNPRFVSDGAGGSSHRGVQGFVFNAAGTRLYGTVLDFGAVVDFSRDPVTGALTFIEAHVGLITPSVLLADPGEPALSPDEKHLYVPDGGQILIFATAAPEPGAVAAMGVALLCLAAAAQLRGAASSRARAPRVSRRP
jgi:6-phosphogluconolactonase (cycloisomerase 2 family)